MRLTDGRGVDVSIEALGLQATFEAALRVLRPGGTLSSRSASIPATCTIPLDAFAAGLGDHTILTTLCPGGKERMRRLMDIIDVGALRLDAARHAPLRARRHREGLRPVHKPARRRPEDRHHACKSLLRQNTRAGKIVTY